MRIRILLILLVLVVSICSLSFAEDITGRVVDRSGGKPLQHVTVMVLRMPDSTRVTGGITGKNGEFMIAGIPSGDYILRVSLVSYATRFVRVTPLTGGAGSIEVGTVALAETPVDMKEVVVSGERAMFTQEIDRKVYNVQLDIAATSGSASDLLRNIPSVEVDMEGTVSLRGSSDVLILINGKNSQLMGANRGEVLEQLPANAIERIEVITNPSARYRPDGTAGIINIELKKDSEIGVNGSIAVQAGVDDRMGGNSRLNYRSGGTNIFANYSARQDTRNRAGAELRLQNPGNGEENSYVQDSRSLMRPFSQTAMAGVEQELGDATTVGLSGNYFRNRATMNGMTGIFRAARTGTTASERSDAETSIEEEAGLKASFEQQFGGKDHALQVEVQVERESEEEQTDARTAYSTPGYLPTREAAGNLQVSHQTEVTADYTLPLPGESKFEAGYSGHFSAYDFDARVEALDNSAGRMIVDPAQTNRFLQNEALHAVYATYATAVGGFGIKAGLRGETVFRTSELVTLSTIVKSDYTAFYPTLHLSYGLYPGVDLQLNYSRRTHRPHGEQLNPFPEYRDPRNVSVGNPRLLPEYIHSVEAGCKIQTDLITILPAVYYRRTDNRFTSVVRALDDSTLISTEENLASDRSAGVELVLTGGKAGVFSVNGSINGFNSTIDAANLGYTESRSVWSWGGSATVNAYITSATSFQISAYYRSARLSPQGTYAPTGSVNVGMRQDLWNRRLSLVLTVADLFRSSRRVLDLETPLLVQRSVGIRDAGVVMLGITFRFGNRTEERDEEAIPYDGSPEQ